MFRVIFQEKVTTSLSVKNYIGQTNFSQMRVRKEARVHINSVTRLINETGT